MKKILTLVTLLSITTLTAQNVPSNYDGGSELQRAIIKVRENEKSGKKTPTTKTQSNKKEVVVKKIEPPKRTKEEELYLILHKEDSPSYIRKLIESDYYKYQMNVAEQEEINYETQRIKKQNQDSIIREENAKIYFEQLKKQEDERKYYRENQKYLDSISNVKAQNDLKDRLKSAQEYYNKSIEGQQKKNRKSKSKK